METIMEQRFIKIIKNDNELMRLLNIVRKLDLPDAFIGAGAVRNLVWDSLHKYGNRTFLNDVDVVYFNSKNMTPEADLKIWEKLCEIDSRINWNVFNQARSHIKDKFRNKAYSTEEGIASWSETATCIGVRLNKDNSLTICAPHGLDDLMNLVVKAVPKPYQDLKLYNKRIEEKGWIKTWPKLQIISF